MPDGPIHTPLDRTLRPGTRVFFGMGQVAEGLKNFSFTFFALFYYNQVLGLSASLTGLALGIALVVDAVTDPLMGSVSDNFDSRWGRRHPFMVGAALPLALSFYTLFAPPPNLSTDGLFYWLTGFTLLTRLWMTVYHVPHIALGAELTANYEERTTLVAIRQISGYFGIFAVAGIGLGHFFADERGGRLNGAAYADFAAVMGGVMVATILASAWFTRDQIPFLPTHRTRDAPARHPLARVVAETRAAFGNASFRPLFVGVLLIYILVGTEGALSLYMYEFFWALAGRDMVVLLVCYPLGLVGGAMLTTRFHRRWDKGPTLIFGTAGWAFFQLLPVILRLLGLFPENGSPLLIASLGGLRLVQGVVVQQALASFSSMMGDITDEHELATGRRQEGIFFGVVAFSGKAAS
ncbi:MAG: MFS transporter, partial [Myxococcota bacterium]